MNYCIWVLGWLICLIFSMNKFKFAINQERTVAVEMILRFIPVILVFLLLTSNRTGRDIINYVNRYRYIHIITAREPLFSWLSMFFYSKGISFFQFRALLTGITGLFAIRALYKLDFIITDYLLFYFPLFLFIDSMQFRNQIAVFMLVWALYQLIEHEGKRGIIIYIVSILIIAQVHVVYYFYLLVLLVYSRKREQILNIIMGLSITIGIITKINGSKIPFIKELLSLFLSEGDNRIDLYDTVGRWGFLFPTLLLLLITFSLTYTLAIINDECFNLKQKKIICITDTINKLSFLLIPFTMMNMNYYRFMRNSYIFYILCSIIFLRNRGIRKKKLSVLIAVLIFSYIAWFCFDILYYNTNNGVMIMDTVLKYGKMFWE